MPPGIFETVLYAEDLNAAECFYHQVMGLEVLTRSELLRSFRCGHGVLLVFDPRQSSTPHREVPSHGTLGVGHIAFGARPEELEAWRERLRAAQVPIEAEVQWPQGGSSIYFRDPARNVVELAPPTLWGGGWKFGDAK
jgi:catechol 2,3-dioxygenase-like lactoylglutathione lyase family enzyme